VFRLNVSVKGKAIPVSGRGGPESLGTSRLAYLLGIGGRDSGEVDSLTCRPPALCPQEDSWFSFLLEIESIPGPKCGYKD
jgi:hypothetical protein